MEENCKGTQRENDGKLSFLSKMLGTIIKGSSYT